MIFGHLDLAALALSTLLVAAYFAAMKVRARRNPESTVHRVNATVRARWAASMQAGRGQEIVAIQTLRNSVMSASFMASTAILLIIATLSAGGSLGGSDGLWSGLHRALHVDPGSAGPKLVFLLADFFVAFFCFSMAIRYFNHVGYMITLPSQEDADARRVAAYLNRAGAAYAVGTRAFFFSVPLVMWLFGPLFLPTATLAILIALYPFDRPPKGV